jgi:hypothetical protein
MGRAGDEDYASADVLLLGRATYEIFAGAWPDREAAGGDDGAFATALGDRRKIVVSRKPLESTWRDTELLDGELVEAVTALEADPAVRGILIPGSISVVQQLLRRDSSTSCASWCTPWRRGPAGACSTTGRASPYHLSPLKSETFPTGVVRLLYAPAPVPGKTTYDDVKSMGPGTGD